MSAEVLRVRHSRTPGGISMTLGSLVAGLGGATIMPLRSGAIEKSFDGTFVLVWYVVLAVGAVCRAYALTSPGWRDHDQRPPSRHRITRYVRARPYLAPFSRPWATLVTEDNYRRIVARLGADEIGCYLIGWLWVSYGFAALALQGAGGFTALSLAAVIVGLDTALRLVELHNDTRGLRQWKADQDEKARAAAAEEG